VPVLKGEREVQFRKDPKPSKRRGERGGGGARVDPGAQLQTAEERELFEALRGKRADLARSQGVPPYVVFDNRTLIDMVKRRPKALSDMTYVTGVGEVKLRKYGQAFLDVIVQHAGV